MVSAVIRSPMTTLNMLLGAARYSESTRTTQQQLSNASLAYLKVEFSPLQQLQEGFNLIKFFFCSYKICIVLCVPLFLLMSGEGVRKSQDIQWQTATTTMFLCFFSEEEYNVLRSIILLLFQKDIFMSYTTLPSTQQIKSVVHE